MRKAWMITAICAAIALCALSAEPGSPATEAALGRKLFFDPIISLTRKVSCASCHRPEYGFADTSAVSTGIYGRKGIRNTPSAMNVSLQATFFWDGRAATLEEQALVPIANPDEMGLPIAKAVARLKEDRYYRKAFQQLYHAAPNAINLAKAIAAFERTLETNDTPFDDWRVNENDQAINASAKRGFELFNGKAKCVKCHFGPDLNNVEFRNIGLYDGRRLTDSGRAAITHKAEDLGKFKIGPLRNIALTAPYMHNGMFKTLAEVIDYYNDPDKVVPHAINRDTILKPLHLSEKEKHDLEAFLLTLNKKT